MANKQQLFTLEISSDLANLARVAEFVLDVSRQLELSERQSDDVQMAVDEAVTNVMEHAYSGRSDGRIWIQCEQRKRDLVIEIRDHGKPFDASKVKTPDIRGPLSRRSIGGLGIFFMRKLMDKVEFIREADTGNLVRMTKRVK